MFVVIFDPSHPTTPYVVGPFPTRAHAEAYAESDPDSMLNSDRGVTHLVVELNAPATLTYKPSCLTASQHRRAELEGWSIFVHADGHDYVERIDALDILPDDTAAYRLARRMGLRVAATGRVVGKAIRRGISSVRRNPSRAGTRRRPRGAK